MLMESEHSMAREDRDGSGTEMEFMAFVSFWGKYVGEVREECLSRTGTSNYAMA
jgi:hypothetical protein